MEMSPQMIITGRKALLSSNPQTDIEWISTGQLMIGYTQALIVEAQKQQAEAQAAKVAADAKSNGTKPLEPPTKKPVSKAVNKAMDANAE